ncbi:MAG TPA: hypothetical protein VER96_26480 [Polyangiaceae bacterium]|nr:hypothetical protein [Polyangiaceae bacterium]
MTHDDAHTSHNHGFELPSAPEVVVRSDPRPWRAVAGVAVCLGLAGIVTGLVIARRHSVSDEHITSDALQREDLRDGWRALGVAAVREAQDREAEKSAAAPAPVNPANQAALPNVVIVNLPTPSSSAAPSNVTNITLPNRATTNSGVEPSDTWNFSSGYAPNQTVPPANYSPTQGYVPVPMSYPLPPDTNAPRSNSVTQNGYGAPPSGVAPSVGNNSIPGSSPSPALPNGGLVGSTPSAPTGSPNGAVTPNMPMGTASVSPGQPSLPSGFSAP